ncbi:MAG: hypothetical protein EPO21_22005 [Chloroflexota bacterium]|nr:MAG: hypothetical protein EPO21_22005 [Chloroflexota bacterium]
MEDESSLMRFPFDLPERFLDEVHYTGPDQLVGLYWQSAGDELAVYDHQSEWVGMHNHNVWLKLSRDPRIWSWLDDHYVNLGSSDGTESHHMIVWKERNESYVAKVRQARRIVREQRLSPEDFF